MNNKKLKPGWRRVKFGDVVRLSKAKSKDPLADCIERYVGLEHLEPGDLRIRRWGNVADGVTFTSVFQPGQVLFGKRRAYQRKVAVADFSGVCSGDIYVFETKDAQVLLPDLLPFICQSDAFFEHAVGTSAGSLSPRTNWTSLANYVFLLPPLEEQVNIALLLASADEHIYQIQSTRSSLWNLERSAIQSILGDERYWQMTTMKSIVKRIDAGKSPKASSLPAESNEYGVLKVSAVGSQGYCSDENKALIDSDDFVVDATVQPGDFLVTRANAQSQGVARTCIVENTPSNLMLSDKTWRLNFEGDAPPKRFVLAWTKLPKFRSYIEALCSGTEAKNISQAKFLAGPMVVLNEKQQFDIDQLLCQTDLTRKVLEERERVSATMKRALLKKSLGEN
ncbi:restriction endonuclease [Aeromonas media]|uniref:restriction endonuclease subunit S n=1 Tax=Aeromonas media TaxID=651 RepID=UPI0011170ADE|nr:restriction endonuclease subunit S [Aeromonas media]TNI63481.1 restriction endonuclease [Aeromonas media]